jgi:tellurite resistance protein
MNATTRIPLNLFGVPFGLAGLANAWYCAGVHDQAPEAVADVLLAISAVVWVVVLVLYVQSATRHRSLAADLTDPVLGPFGALVVITPMVLALDGVVPHALALGRVLVDVCVALVVVGGAWYTGQWIYGPLEYIKLHPGYFLPTVAGGLLASAAAGAVHQERLAQVMFGFGLICWLILGSMVLARLMFGPPLPPPLTPTLAIEVAPAAAATLAYLSIHGDRIDAAAAAIGGYGLLMALAQIRLLPAFLRLSFVPGFWAFIFSWTAVVTAALHWLVDLQPNGWRVYGYLLLAAVSALVAAIATRTAVAISRGELLPAAVPHPTS